MSWKLFEWIKDRYERTISDLIQKMKHPLKVKAFINRPGGFFHYEPLSTSFFSKNLIIPEAVIFSKSKSVIITLV